MKRLAFAIAGLPRPSGHRVGGDLGHERPRINVMRWKGRTGDRDRAGLREERTCAEEILIIRAHDPDSAITEIEV